MTFDEWKVEQFNKGLLVNSDTNSTKYYPYKSKCSWMIKLERIGQDNSNVEVELSPDEYLKLAYDAGLEYEQLGNGKYCVCRIGDIGNYTYENCYYGSWSDNARDRVLSGASRKQAEKISGIKNPKFKGVYHTPNGSFINEAKAGNSNNCSAHAARTRCLSPDRNVVQQSTIKCPDLRKHLGKTYRELGWWFEEKSVG